MSAPDFDIPALVAKLEVTGNDFMEARIACLGLIAVLMDDYEATAPVLARTGGAAAAAMYLMEQCPKDKIIQHCGCLILLYNSCFDITCREEIHEQGGIPLLLTALDNFINDEIVRQTALNALRAFVSLAPSAILDGFPVILRVMKHHLEDNKSLQVACDMMAILTSKKHFGDRTACDHGLLLLNAGCVPIVATCLGNVVAHPIDTQDEKLALSILRAFTQLLGVNTETTARDLVEHGSLGFTAILDVMRRWNDCIDIQFHSCYILATCQKFCRQDTSAAIVESGGIEVIINAIKLFLRTTSINGQTLLGYHHYAVLALGRLAHSSGESASALQSAQGLPVFIDVMQEPFPNCSRDARRILHSSSITALMHCFTKLAKDHADRARGFISEMITCGAVPTILMSMRQFEDSVIIQACGCILLVAMTKTGKGNGPEIVVNGGRRILERAVIRHEDNEHVQKYGNETLELLSGIDEIDRCHACLASAEKLMHCSRCMQVFYCNRKCQKEDYKLHKKLCKQMASRASADNVS